MVNISFLKKGTFWKKMKKMGKETMEIDKSLYGCNLDSHSQLASVTFYSATYYPKGTWFAKAFLISWSRLESIMKHWSNIEINKKTGTQKDVLYNDLQTKNL